MAKAWRNGESGGENNVCQLRKSANSIVQPRRNEEAAIGVVFSNGIGEAYRKYSACGEAGGVESANLAKKAKSRRHQSVAAKGGEAWHGGCRRQRLA